MKDKVPTGKDFYNLIKIRFSDCWDEIRDITNLNPNALDDKLCLAHTLSMLFGLYAGRILEDSRETGLYIGPTDHRVKTLLTSYCDDVACLFCVKTKSSLSEVKSECYKDLGQIGCRKHEK